MTEKQLCAGAAKRDITPEKELLPIPFVGPICMDRAADSISVRALYLESGAKPALLVDFDLGEVPYVPETLAFLQALTGLESESMFLTATHTHGTPFLGWPLMPVDEKTERIYRRWYEEIKDALKEAVQEAIASKRPAKMGYTEGKSYINVNRDEKIDGVYTYGSNYERPSDKTLRLVRFEDEAGEPIALVVNYAVHGVVVNGCMIGDALWLSGDLPGRTETALEEKLGGVVLWTSAAAGDQNPRVIGNLGYDESSDGLRTKSLGEAGYMLLDVLNAEHVRNILAAHEKLVCGTEYAEISAAERNVSMRAKGTKEEDAATVPFVLKLLRLGGLVIAGVSAEVVTTVGQTLCGLSDAEHTIMITHMQGSSGYLPDEWEYEVGAQEVGESLVERGCAGPVLIQAFQEMLASVHAQKTGS